MEKKKEKKKERKIQKFHIRPLARSPLSFLLSCNLEARKEGGPSFPSSIRQADEERGSDQDDDDEKEETEEVQEQRSLLCIGSISVYILPRRKNLRKKSGILFSADACRICLLAGLLKFTGCWLTSISRKEERIGGFFECFAGESGENSHKRRGR